MRLRHLVLELESPYVHKYFLINQIWTLTSIIETKLGTQDMDILISLTLESLFFSSALVGAPPLPLHSTIVR